MKSSTLPRLYSAHVAAGFPSPADDYEDTALDLNRYFIKHPAATFFVRAQGESMIGAGIFNGDMLIVDRAVSPESGMVIIAVVEGDFTVKRYINQNRSVILRAENDAYRDIVIQEGSDFEIWGVVIQVIHNPN